MARIKLKICVAEPHEAKGKLPTETNKHKEKQEP